MKVKEESEKAGLKLNIQKTKIMASGSITLWQVDGETIETVTDFLFLGSKITVHGDSSHEIRRCLPLGRKAKTNLDSILKSRDITLPTKVCIVKATSSHVWMWELKGWALKNSCFHTVVLEKTSERPLGSKEIKPVNSKGNQPWIFIGKTDTEAEAPILWPPDAKSWLTGKDSDAGKDWRQKEKGATEDEIAGWHHQRSGLGLSKLQETDSGGQGSLVCCCVKSQRAGHEWVTEQQQQHTWGGSGVHHLPTQTLRGSALIAFLA